MLILKNDVYQSSLLSGISGLFHGYSTRALGDARVEENAQTILRRLTDSHRTLVRAQQIHGNEVSFVDDATSHTVAGVDGLVTRNSDIALEVHVADCAPVLLIDPQARVICAVHAGWKGTLSHIVGNAITRMTEQGASSDHIYASVGPHIGGCCYTVPKERADRFLSEFGRDTPVVFKEADGWHLDIGLSNRMELLHSGIAPDHMDTPVVCTSCQVDTFYSYRKETKQTFGEMIGVIGFAA